MSTVLVLAPHPDDETLGCGGTLLRHIAAGDAVHWAIGTEPGPQVGFDAARIAVRDAEIDAVATRFGFAAVHRLGFPAAETDTVPERERVGRMSALVSEVTPEILYLPHRGDAHGDHAVLFDAAAACTKWFRHPSLRRVLAYQTLSETEMALAPEPRFAANVFNDISGHLAAKIEIMGLYASETGDFPFPRSAGAIEAQARLAGARIGTDAAEAFMLLYEKR